MSNVELLEASTKTGLDVVSLEEMKRHIRTSVQGTGMDVELTQAINAAVDWLDAPHGLLNRSILPKTWRLDLPAFPKCGEIELPFPDLIELKSFSYQEPEGSESPLPVVDTDLYRVKTIHMMPTILLQPTRTWPAIGNYRDAVSIVYESGYKDDKYPPILKQLILLTAAHFLENKELTINEPRQMMVNRMIEFGFNHLVERLRVPIGASYG